jgi:hypothetical protein
MVEGGKPPFLHPPRLDIAGINNNGRGRPISIGKHNTAMRHNVVRECTLVPPANPRRCPNGNDVMIEGFPETGGK